MEDGAITSSRTENKQTMILNGAKMNDSLPDGALPDIHSSDSHFMGTISSKETGDHKSISSTIPEEVGFVEMHKRTKSHRTPCSRNFKTTIPCPKIP